MNIFGILSYGSAALAFLLLSVLLAVSWRGGREGLRFIVAAAISIVWSLVGVAQAALPQGLPVALVFTAELLRDGAWLVALAALAGSVLPRALALFCSSIAALLIAAVWLLPLVTALTTGGVSNALLIPAGLGAAVLGLLLLEQIYRNASASARYGFKFLAIGLGGVFAYDLFLYSQAQLFQSISAEVWQARGLVNAVLVPLLAVAARRNPQWSLDIFVSRQAVLFTTSVVAVGVYLLLMSLGGYYIQRFGGRWGLIANVLFICAAIVVLAIVVASGAVRRRLKVFFHKHFFRNKYDYRLEWLRFVATLSEGHGPDVRATILKAIAQVFESAGGLLFLRGEGSDRYDLVDAWPGPLSAHPAVEAIAGNHEFITALRDRRWVIDLLEYRESPEFYQNLEVPDSLRSLADFRIISPLLATEGLTGFVMLREPPPPFDLTYEDRDLLVTLGRHVAVILSQQQAEWHLAEARQFEAYHRLTAFMMHDLKNLVAQLNLVVANSARHRANPAFIDDALDTVANAASRMSQLIGQLSRKQDADAREPVELGGLVGEVVARCADREPRPVLLSSPGAAARAMTLADPVRLAAVLDHVIRNAQDASAPGSALELSLDEGDGQWRISIRDQGEGMTAEFVRTRLFRPFDSTKGAKGMGIGAYQVQEYIRMLGGDVEVQSTPGAGTTFVLRLPQHE